MTWQLDCECGFLLVLDDLKELTDRARSHAKQDHGMELSAEQVELLARRVTADGGNGEATHG